MRILLDDETIQDIEQFNNVEDIDNTALDIIVWVRTDNDRKYYNLLTDEQLSNLKKEYWHEGRKLTYCYETLAEYEEVTKRIGAK